MWFVVVIDVLLGYIMISAASPSVTVPTNDSQVYVRRSGFDTLIHAVKSITRFPGEARTRNLIILHETLFCKNIMHVLAHFKLAYDKSDSYEHDLVKNGNGKAPMMKSYFHFHDNARG